MALIRSVSVGHEEAEKQEREPAQTNTCLRYLSSLVLMNEEGTRRARDRRGPTPNRFGTRRATLQLMGGTPRATSWMLSMHLRVYVRRCKRRERTGQAKQAGLDRGSPTHTFVQTPTAAGQSSKAAAAAAEGYAGPLSVKAAWWVIGPTNHANQLVPHLQAHRGRIQAAICGLRVQCV
jgi:hypothetical protein